MKKEFEGVLKSKNIDDTCHDYMLLNNEELVYVLEEYQDKKVKITVEEID